MGSKEDPEDGGAVAGAVFGAVFIYVVSRVLKKREGVREMGANDDRDSLCFAGFRHCCI